MFIRTELFEKLAVRALHSCFSSLPLRDCLKRVKEELGELPIALCARPPECGRNVVFQTAAAVHCSG